MLRVRGFTQDDAHIFCTPGQLGDEILGVLDLVTDTFRTFGFEDYRFELSVRDPETTSKYAGTDEEWQAAEEALTEALRARGYPYERMEGEAVFYGPKIDVKVIDAIGRPWQLSTIQFDFNLPRRFGIHYVDSDSSHQPPYMVHRAIYGSLERFAGILVEHFAGAFPPWLAPVQVRLLPITDRVLSYCDEVADRCRRAGLRAEVDRRAEKIGHKIRDAQLEKVPYMLVVGDREAGSGQVALRLRSEGDQGSQPVETFLDRAREAVQSRSLEP
jgi:threonyl-tRNA synthetase